MARLFIKRNGKQYEKKFRKDGTPFYVDQRGTAVAESMVKQLDAATRPTRAARAVQLTESSRQEAAARRKYLALRQGKPNSTAISEAARLARRRDLHMAAGMNFDEPSIAARGRWERG